MGSNNLNFKRTLRKYEYLTEELEDVKILYDEFSISFEKALREAGYEPDPPTINSGDTETSDVKKPESLLSPKYKKLFRQIVVKTHPDKLGKDISEEEKNYLVGLYEQVVDANDTGDITQILFVAIKLGLDVTDYMEDIQSILESCEMLEGEINKLQKSSCWHWNQLTNEKEKEEFVKKFISFINK